MWEVCDVHLCRRCCRMFLLRNDLSMKWTAELHLEHYNTQKSTSGDCMHAHLSPEAQIEVSLTLEGLDGVDLYCIRLLVACDDVDSEPEVIRNCLHRLPVKPTENRCAHCNEVTCSVWCPSQQSHFACSRCTSAHATMTACQDGYREWPRTH